MYVKDSAGLALFIWLLKVDISMPFAFILAAKDTEELQCLKKAAEITSSLYLNQLRANILDIVDGEKVLC